MSNRKLRVTGEISQKGMSYSLILEFFYRVLRTPVVLPEGKIRASVNLITFTFIQLAVVYVSYLSLKKVFLNLNNYLHLKMASP